jgi:hypothetical protein
MLRKKFINSHSEVEVKTKELILIILLFLLGIVVLSFLTSLVDAAPADQPEFPAAVFVGEGPLSVSMTEGKNYVLKPKGGLKFELILGSDQNYELPNSARLWETNANMAPTVLYQQTINLGQVEAGCIIDYLQLDDDIDSRVNHFSINGVQAHTVAQGMAVKGNFVVSAIGELEFTANDSVAIWLGICEKKITPTPSPTGTATSTPTATATVTATPAHSTYVLYLPMTAGKNEPPPTVTPSPTPEPADWLWVSCYGDPHCWNGQFSPETVPSWQERPPVEQTWLSEWPNGKQLALAAHGHTIEFELQPYGDLQFISKVLVDGQEIQAKQGEVVEIDLGDVYVLVSESCGTFECQDPQIWWRESPEASGLLVDVFNSIQRAKAANQ